MIKTAWVYTWQRRYMLLLGCIAAALTFAAVGPRYSFSINIQGNLLPERQEQEPPPPPTTGPIAEGVVIIGVVAGWGLLGILNTLGRVARGAIMAGTEQLERVGTSSFELAWAPAWRSGRSLFVISLLTYLPLLAFLLGLAFRLETPAVFLSPLQTIPFNALGWMAASALVGLLILGLLRVFADRACVLEGASVGQAYQQGWRILRSNVLAVGGIYLLTISIRVLVGGLFFIAGIYSIVCFLLWPALLVINGMLETYLNTLWTLLYQEWSTAA